MSFAIGEIVRYDTGNTALMRITSFHSGRVYGKSFHSSGTDVSRGREQLSHPSQNDLALWASSHDNRDNWIVGKWRAETVSEPSDGLSPFSPISALSFGSLRIANVTRCEEVFHPIADWTPAEWAVAMAGECGEACNAVKKLRRLADGTNTAKDPQTETEAIEAIADELADLIIYADLLAARLEIDLGRAVQDKFNAVSILRKSSIRLGSEGMAL